MEQDGRAVFSPSIHTHTQLYDRIALLSLFHGTVCLLGGCFGAPEKKQEKVNLIK